MNNITHIHDKFNPDIDAVQEKILDIINTDCAGKFKLATVVGILEVIKSDLISGEW